ncbi:ComEC family competence protein [Neorickettsia findlayensis]|uniref:ComEC family competence protein n=1 Tax=Neorickettsia findlayensis TaxID=2686014 RepID=A0A6P1G9T6_9RICK|nr:ComEC family competence protein [Neorickettsia findlayensis]
MITKNQINLFLWTPFLLSIGIILFFEATFYPKAYHLVFTIFGLGIQLCLAYIVRKARTALLVSGIISAGFISAEIRTLVSYTEMIKTPQYLQNATGIVQSLSHRKTGILITMKHAGSSLKLYSTKSLPDLRSGDVVNFSAYIFPVQGAATPSGYDFAMFQYFSGVRATGRLIGKITIVKSTGHQSIFPRIRKVIHEKFKYNLAEIPSEIALALTIGKRDGIDLKINELFRKSGTSHLLAISGLHMGLVGLFFFSLLRRACTLSEHLTLKYDIKKISVIAGVASSIFYLQLSGMQTSAQRACIMTCTLFLSILLDRKADTLRSVIFAATVLITLYPESIFKPGFQMSFFAVLGICFCNRRSSLYTHTEFTPLFMGKSKFEIQELSAVIQHEITLIPKPRHQTKPRNDTTRRSFLCLWKFSTDSFHKGQTKSFCKSILKPLTYLSGVIKTSLFATAATTPFALYHFHSLSVIGLAANTIAIPFTSFLIIPTLAGILLLMPLYDSEFLYTLLSVEIKILLRLMESFNHLHLGYFEVQGFSGITLLVMVTGTLSLLVGTTWKRYLGIIPIAIGVAMIQFSPLPDIFISEKNIAIRSQDNNLYFLNASRIPQNFIAKKWLQYSGCKASKISNTLNSGIEKREGSYVYTKNGKAITITFAKNPKNKTRNNFSVQIDRPLTDNKKTYALLEIRENQNVFISIRNNGIKTTRGRNWPQEILASK